MALADHIPWVTAWSQVLALAVGVVNLALFGWLVLHGWWLRQAARAKLDRLDRATDELCNLIRVQHRALDLTADTRRDTARAVSEVKAVVSEVKAAVAANPGSESGLMKTPPLPPPTPAGS